MMNLDRVKEEIRNSEKILIGFGEEWQTRGGEDMAAVYNALHTWIRDRDYFIVTTNTDAKIFKSNLNPDLIVAPCGNETWRQCSRACTKDIWEQGEVLDDICPHCGAPLTGNTIKAETYIEEGYLPQWNAYTDWLTHTLNRNLLILELGVGFGTPTVIRWPFEKTVYFNKKAHMYRVHKTLFQISEEMKGKAEPVAEYSVDWVKRLCRE